MSRQSGSVLAPVLSPPPQAPKPVDLTSSLLQSNLTQLSLKPTQNIPPNTGQNLRMNNPLNTGQNLDFMSPNTGQGFTNNMGMNNSFGNQMALPPSMGWTSPTNSYASTNFSSLNFGNAGSFNQNVSTSSYISPTSSINNTAGNFNNKWANNQNKQINAKQDWSAFESLLPTSNNNSNDSSKKNDNTNESVDLLS